MKILTKKPRRCLSSSFHLSSSSVVALVVSLAAHYAYSHPTFPCIGAWALLQWFYPITTSDMSAGCSGSENKNVYCMIFDQITRLQEGKRPRQHNEQEPHFVANSNIIEIPTADVQKHRHDMLQNLEQKFGKDWRRRPVLFKGLWTADELVLNTDGTPRKLSMENLLQMDLTIPYFYNATIKTITPDGLGSVSNILRNITLGRPHKIGTQLIVENDPDLIQEVAPLDLISELFGGYFTSDRVRGSGPWNMFPAMTTVPIFIAKNEGKGPIANTNTTPQGPFTTLHCEPIGNIAVQLSGRKKWTLVLPEHSFRIKPGISPDGRAFFASWANESEIDDVPKYEVATAAGDALWVPTWTWHRVDYIPSEDVSLAASLFHFRVLDFYQNNPLFAALMIPAMVKELLGFNTQ